MGFRPSHLSRWRLQADEILQETGSFGVCAPSLVLADSLGNSHTAQPKILRSRAQVYEDLGSSSLFSQVLEPGD